MSTEPIAGTDALEARPSGDAAAIIQAAQETGKPIPVLTGAAESERVFTVLVPAGAEVHSLDLEEYGDHPRRARGTVEVATVVSFSDYVKAHTTDATTVWVHPTKGEVIAVLDDHTGGKPSKTDQEQDTSLAGWGEHRARLKLEHTDEWKFWLGANNKLVSQDAFAEHIEVGQLDVSEPDGADLLEIAQSISASTSAEFRSARRLDNGEVQFLYSETIDARAGRTGDMKIPATFKLLVRPFIGEEPFSLTARLRYRISEGVLTIGYKIDRPDVAVRDAIELVAVRIRDAHERVYSGLPR